MINQGTNLEPEDETAATILEELAALSDMGGEEILPPSQLGPHESNIAMGERYFLRGLQGVAFQPSMKCKGEDMAWENSNPHGGSTKGGRRRRHP